MSKKISYIGIDETGLGIDGSIIVAAAETHNSLLAKDNGFKSLDKAKDLVARYVASDEHNYPFPSLAELKSQGLENFYWTRATGGRFSRQILEHASIAFLVAGNGYDPKSTVLLIDAFHGNDGLSRYLITEYLNMCGFRIPKKNVELIPGGDRSVPIINMADILAFQIGLYMNERYRNFFPKRIRFDIEPQEIPYDEARVSGVDNEGRSLLEKILAAWH